MLTCQEMTELVADHLEGRQNLWQRLQFQLHVGRCRHCRAYLHQMQQTIRMLGQVPPDPVPEEVCKELQARFRDWKR